MVWRIREEGKPFAAVAMPATAAKVLLCDCVLALDTAAASRDERARANILAGFKPAWRDQRCGAFVFWAVALAGAAVSLQTSAYFSESGAVTARSAATKQSRGIAATPARLASGSR
jgi:hypothetical protein